MNIYRIFIVFFILPGNACANTSTDLQKIITASINDKANQTHRASLRELIKWPDSCEESFSFPTAGFVFFKKDANNYVAQIICTYGSYQGMSLFYKISNPDHSPTITKIIFPAGKTGTKPLTEIWGNVLTSSTVEQFHILNLYSGFGHCGSLTTYDLSNTPSITMQKIQDNCESKTASRNPEEWKTVIPGK